MEKKSGLITKIENGFNMEVLTVYSVNKRTNTSRYSYTDFIAKKRETLIKYASDKKIIVG